MVSACISAFGAKTQTISDNLLIANGTMSNIRLVFEKVNTDGPLSMYVDDSTLYTVNATESEKTAFINSFEVGKPVVSASNEYTVDGKTIEVDGTATIADITTTNNAAVRVYNNGNLITDTSAALKHGYKVVLEDAAHKIYNYYDVVQKGYLVVADDATSLENSALHLGGAKIEGLPGKLGKATDDEIVKSTEAAVSTKYYYYAYDFDEEIYLENGKRREGYIVAELNVYTDDANMNMFRFGLSGNQVPFVGDISFSKLKTNSWNHLRLVYKAPDTVVDWKNDVPDIAEDKDAIGKSLGHSVVYVNGAKFGEKDLTIGSGTYSTGTNFSEKINKIILMFYSNETSAAHYVYVDDIKIYETDTDPGAPKMATLKNEGEKYFVDNTGGKIIYEDAITIADLQADNLALELVAFSDSTYATQLETGATLASGNVVSSKSEDGVYSAYTVTDNTFTDDNGNKYTWKIHDNKLTIGLIESELGKTNYKNIKTDSYSDSKVLAANRPWQNFVNTIQSIEFEPLEVKNGNTTTTHVITGLGRQMFEGLAAMKSVTIPKTITSFGWGVFNASKGIETVTFEYGCTNGGTDKLFQNCTSLKTVNLPSTCTKISGRAYYGCTSLAEIILPSNMTDISITDNTASGGNVQEHAFTGCGGITIKYYGGTKTATMLETFKNKINAFTVGTTGDAQGIKYEMISSAPTGFEPDSTGVINAIKWEIKDDTLTFTGVENVGNGEMMNYANVSTKPWNLYSYKNVVFGNGIKKMGWHTLLSAPALDTVTVTSSVTSSDLYVMVGNTIDKLIFEEGCADVFKKAQVVNRDSKVANLYLPSTATEINSQFIRAIGTDNSEAYSGCDIMNIYAPENSAAQAWAENVKSRSKDEYTGEYDLSVAPIAPTKPDPKNYTDGENDAEYKEALEKYNTDKAYYDKVNPVYCSVKTVNIFPTLTITNNDTSAIIINNGVKEVTADVIVAYYKSGVLQKAVVTSDKTIAVGENAITFDSGVDSDDVVVYLWKNIDNMVPMAISK